MLEVGPSPGLAVAAPAARPASHSTTPPSGGNPIHGLLGWEEAEILALFDEWADIDRSHRKLAHRGSYEGRVWVSPSTVDRVLARQRPASCKDEPRPPRSVEDTVAGLVRVAPEPAVVLGRLPVRTLRGLQVRVRHRRSGVPQVDRQSSHPRTEPDVGAGAVPQSPRRRRACSPTNSEPASPIPTTPIPDDDDSIPMLLGDLRQRHRDARRRDPQVHGADARSPNTSADPRHRPTRPGSRRCGATSSASTRT